MSVSATFDQSNVFHLNENSRWVSFAIFIYFGLIALAIMAPIASTTLVSSHADFQNHLVAIIQAKLALSEGQFPLREMPISLSGIRYPFFQFSSPTAYMLAGAIYKWLIPNPQLVMESLMWVMITVGGFFIYRVAYWLFRSSYAAILGGVAYLLTPYYIIAINSLSDYGEVVGLGLFPVILFYMLKYYFDPKNKKLLLCLSVGWYLLITIHLVTFVYASLFSMALLFLLSIRNKQFRGLIANILACAWGCLLAVWFLMPIVLLKSLIFISKTYVGHSASYFYIITLSQLLFPAASFSMGYSSALMAIHPSVGWPILISAIVCIFVFFKKNTTMLNDRYHAMPLLFILFSIAFLMAWSPFNVLNHFPQLLQVGQYSWRLLGQVMWLGALLFVWVVCWFFQEKLDIRHVAIGSVLLAMSASVWFLPSEPTSRSMEDFIKNPLMVYNGETYLLDFTNNFSLVNKVDNVLIDPSALATVYHLPEKLIDSKNLLLISIEGKRPANKKNQLSAMLDGTLLSKQSFSGGAFSWHIPLHVQKTKAIHELSIVDSQNPKKKVSLYAEKVFITGFMKNAEVLNVGQVKSFCHVEKSMTVCKVAVPSSVKILELPVWYYPDMLKVTLNGRTVKYQSVLRDGRLFVGIIPEPGKTNTVTAQFTGFVFENYFSLAMWGLWLMTLLSVLFGKKKHAAQPE